MLPEQFSDAIARHHAALVRYARTRFDAATADDVVQIALAELALKAAAFTPPDTQPDRDKAIRSWLFRAVKWRIKTAHRQQAAMRRRHRRVAQEPQAAVPHEAIADALRETRELPAWARDVLELRYVVGLRGAALAACLGTAARSGGAEKRVRRALRLLRARLRGEPVEEKPRTGPRRRHKDAVVPLDAVVLVDAPAGRSSSTLTLQTDPRARA